MTYHAHTGFRIGMALAEALDEMITSRRIEPLLAMRLMEKFDQCMSSVLSQQVRNKMSFKGKIDRYRFVDDVWTIILNDVSLNVADAGIRTDSSPDITVARIKIVAIRSKEARNS
ncbi:transcription initiation factor IIA, gamma subunit [Piedraia hortae CBS 480.64]|uniref:Transcription initiation factor IIA subunit 2 n=1 Tax=Piedraia hortae CBS 480.64 TaxID=1314780 RepID=A0A6A7BQZ3_9PEZI|nr:transcription initiation factor IIA, gamma subunit [Piedraia hortae CBS 480.64]